ncbi:hypothetical protein BDR05DRAFT_970238 [Suillus weaverae]|nr:hypothetical protein BDR05DRAFT_970238 [Suillus weaverae]
MDRGCAKRATRPGIPMPQLAAFASSPFRRAWTFASSISVPCKPTAIVASERDLCVETTCNNVYYGLYRCFDIPHRAWMSAAGEALRNGSQERT